MRRQEFHWRHIKIESCWRENQICKVALSTKVWVVSATSPCAAVWLAPLRHRLSTLKKLTLTLYCPKINSWICRNILHIVNPLFMNTTKNWQTLFDWSRFCFIGGTQLCSFKSESAPTVKYVGATQSDLALELKKKVLPLFRDCAVSRDWKSQSQLVN